MSFIDFVKFFEEDSVGDVGSVLIESDVVWINLF